MIKKLFIYRKIQHSNTNELLRTISIHHSFVGIGKNGQINTFEFKKLAEDLEPSSTSYNVTDI